MKFTIVSHACIYIEHEDIRLLVDPWIIGSCYWRSWWNYPEVSIEILENINPTHIYLTHLHWDHFHGPSLRKLYRGIPKIKFLISRVPEKRLKNDLFEVLNKNIQVIEINHGERFEINSELSAIW